MIKRKRIRCSGSILVLENWGNEEVHGFGSNDTSDHTRVCGSLKACLLTHPTQAITAAPGARPVIAGSYPHDRAGFGLSSRKGPDLGGSKVVGVRDPVVETSTEPSARFSICFRTTTSQAWSTRYTQACPSLRCDCRFLNCWSNLS
jgi:hypothetical protein